MNRTRKLTVRTDRGRIDPPAASYSSGLLQQTESGLVPVCDSDLIEAALAVLAKQVSRGSVLDSPQVVKNFLITRLADLEHEIFGLVLLTLCGPIRYVQLRGSCAARHGFSPV
jgi:hypothetical protein